MDARRLVLGGLITVLAACGTDRDETKIVITVHSDLAVPAVMNAIRLDLSSDGRTVEPSPTFQLTSTGEPGKTPLPVRFAVVPKRANDATFSVTALALQGTTPIVSRTATSRFIPGQVGYIDLSLDRDCLPIQCPSPQTCSQGLCVDSQVVPSVTKDGGPTDARAGIDTARPSDGAVAPVVDAGAGAEADPKRDTGFSASDAAGDDVPGADGALAAEVAGLSDAGTIDAPMVTDTVALPLPDASVARDVDALAAKDMLTALDGPTTTDAPGPVVDAPGPVVDAPGPVVDAPGPVADVAPTVPDSAITPDSATCIPAYALTARAGELLATLQWTGPPASTYRIWRGASPADLTAIASTAATSFTDTSAGLAYGRSVFYQVSTNSGAATCEDSSNVVEVIPCGKPTVNASSFGNDVTVTWDDLGIPQYTLSYGATTSLGTTVTVSGTRYVLGGMPPNQTVYIQVSTSNPTCTGLSEMVHVTPTGCTAWPGVPPLTATPDFQRNVITWPAATGGTGDFSYELSFATEAAGSYQVLSTTAISPHAHEGLVNGTTYYYKIRTRDSAGCASDQSATPAQATPSVAACQSVFCEDFDTASGDAWAVGSWDRSGGALCGLGNTVFATSGLTMAAPGSDQTIQARISLSICSTTQAGKGGGVFLRGSDTVGSSSPNPAGYRLMLECDSVLRLRRSGSNVAICEAPLPASPNGTWHTLKLSVQGETLKGYLDDLAVPLLSCSATTLDAGNAGVVIAGDGRICIDDIRVTSP
jgi:hypothetical protein